MAHDEMLLGPGTIPSTPATMTFFYERLLDASDYKDTSDRSATSTAYPAILSRPRQYSVDISALP